MKLIASLENCAQVSSFSSITVVRSFQTTSISYYSGPNTSILTICGHRSGGESLIRVAANLVIFVQLIKEMTYQIRGNALYLSIRFYYHPTNIQKVMVRRSYTILRRSHDLM